MTNKKLWQQVAAFRFDDSQSALTFSQRLARENGWGLGYAGRVIEEYRRFVYLATAAGHPVTPSDQVDQAWHLHMVYTQSYWQELCEGVLGKPLHHGPTKGGRAESNKFHDWYERTLASYRQEFAEEPPADIWPPSSVRFSTKAKFQRVDLADVWMISKSKLRKALGLGAAAAAMATLLMACDNKNGGGIGDHWIFLFIVIGIIMLAIQAANKPPRQGNGKGGVGSSGGGCSSISGCSSSSSSSNGHSGCGSHGGHSGCGSDGGSSGCSSSGCGSSCGGGCGGGGD